MRITNTRALVAAIAICQLAGLIGMWFIGGSVSGWYATLAKPWLTPPSWIFGPVWITLYLLMGISVYLVWREGPERDDVKKALYMFANQLILNVSWSIIFFNMHNIFLSLVVMLMLGLLVYSTFCYFKKISRDAAYLLIPYMAWVSFAAYLNLAIWLIN